MWTPEHQNLLNRFVAHFGLPTLDADDARRWTVKLAEQFAFAFPAEGWGTKRGSATRPQSTDVICTRTPFLGYDVIISQGTPGQHVAQHPEALDLTGQDYIAVTPRDHFPAPPPVVVPPPPPPVVEPPPPPVVVEPVPEPVPAPAPPAPPPVPPVPPPAKPRLRGSWGRIYQWLLRWK